MINRGKLDSNLKRLTSSERKLTFSFCSLLLVLLSLFLLPIALLNPQFLLFDRSIQPLHSLRTREDSLRNQTLPRRRQEIAQHSRWSSRRSPRWGQEGLHCWKSLQYCRHHLLAMESYQVRLCVTSTEDMRARISRRKAVPRCETRFWLSTLFSFICFFIFSPWSGVQSKDLGPDVKAWIDRIWNRDAVQKGIVSIADASSFKLCLLLFKPSANNSTNSDTELTNVSLNSHFFTCFFVSLRISLRLCSTSPSTIPSTTSWEIQTSRPSMGTKQQREQPRPPSGSWLETKMKTTSNNRSPRSETLNNLCRKFL